MRGAQETGDAKAAEAWTGSAADAFAAAVTESYLGAGGGPRARGRFDAVATLARGAADYRAAVEAVEAGMEAAMARASAAAAKAVGGTAPPAKMPAAVTVPPSVAVTMPVAAPGAQPAAVTVPPSVAVMMPVAAPGANPVAAPLAAKAPSPVARTDRRALALARTRVCGPHACPSSTQTFSYAARAARRYTAARGARLADGTYCFIGVRGDGTVVATTVRGTHSGVAPAVEAAAWLERSRGVPAAQLPALAQRLSLSPGGALALV